MRTSGDIGKLTEENSLNLYYENRNPLEVLEKSCGLCTSYGLERSEKVRFSFQVK